jgi:transcriptional regulator
VPTWNYIAVHACGKLSLVEDADAKDTLLGGLFSAFEPAFAERWAQMPEDYRRAMLAGIVGFRIPIERIEGKFKLCQNRPETDRQTMRAAFAAGDSDQQALAAWMQKLAV